MTSITEDPLYKVRAEDDAKFVGKPHGWIQWKGTGVCMDLHCECGAHGHIDAEFAYFYRCFACGRTYAVGCNVALIPLTSEQQAHAERVSPSCIKMDEKRQEEKEFTALTESDGAEST